MESQAGDDNRDAIVSAAAMAVMKAIEPLTPSERGRVLESAAALYGVGLHKAPLHAASSAVPPSTIGRQAGTPFEEASVPTRKMSLVEFVKDRNPATNAQRIAVFAYYREHHERNENFSRSDLAAYFATARLGKPGNYDRDFAAAAKEGWIHEDGGKSYLTGTGAAAVEAGFAGRGKPRGPSPAV